MNAQLLASALLEDENDEHVKMWKKGQAWIGANKSFKTLFGLHKKKTKLFGEMGRSLAYEAALFHNGLRKEDVRPLVGAQIGSTDNFKSWRVPAKVCNTTWCAKVGRNFPASQEECPSCHRELKPTTRPISPSELRGTYANYIVGVETLDGRRVWFKEPIPPPGYDWSEGEEPTIDKPE